MEEKTVDISISSRERVSLLEVVDRVLNKGAVIAGEVAISVADVDLIKLGLHLVIASSETLLDEVGMGITVEPSSSGEDS